MIEAPLENPVSRQIWDARYRYRLGGVTQDTTVEDTWRRVAKALAEVEVSDRAL